MQNTYLTQWLLFAALVAYVALNATAQGGITLRNRLYVPMAEQSNVNRDLHLLLPACYGLLLAITAHAHGWRWLPIGALLHLALFDPLLNLRKGDALFALGTSAATDKLLARAAWLSPALRIAALAGAVLLMILL